jgi:phosphatidylglycerol phospholipase C
MAAFRRSVEDGVDAIETDVHISKDGVIVLSHDPTLKRCFGVEKKIADCDWKELSEARTLREPHEPLPRLEDLLVYLSEPKAASIWVLLDIKVSLAIHK